MARRELEVDEDPRYSRREAVAERIGWIVILAVVVAGALGLFANGPVSHRTARNGEVEVHHQRFARNQGRTTVEVRVDAAAIEGGEVVVAVPQRFLEAYEVEEIFPEPASVRVDVGDVELVFEVGDGTELRAALHLRPERVGRQRGAVTVGDVAVAFRQFVHP